MYLQKGTPNTIRCHQWGRETSGSTAVNCHTVIFIYCQYDVQWRGPMLPVPRIRTHCLSLLNIRCFDCNEHGHVAADCPDRIPPSGTPAHQKRHHSNTRHHTRSTSRHLHRDRHRYNRSRSQWHSCNYQSHSQNSPHSHRDHSRSYHRHPHRSTSCSHHSSSYHYCRNIPHRRSSTHRSSSTHYRDHSRSRTCTP